MEDRASRHGKPPTVQKLLNPVASAVRAASVLPSLSRVVEELVLNSLDACCSNIEITVDVKTFSVEVRDDGVGINYDDLRDKSGEWNATSKYESGVSHGFRGEALAAIRMLSCMTLTSKTSECRTTYVKSFDMGKSTLHVASSGIIGSGTKVSVMQLFDRLPARRKATRPNIELLRVKEFVQRMSILYHDVGWLLIDDSSGKIVMRLKSQASVSARFSAFHGQQVQIKMKDVSVSHGQFELCGLMSPPLPDSCHWTREYQYFFINNRWMRGTEIVANMIDKVFVAALTSHRSGGPASKHHAPKGCQVSSHPCFVLQLTCPPDSFDVLSEPDKTKAVFTDPYRVKLWVKKLLLKMFETYRPDLLDSADSLCSDYSNPHSSYRSRGRNNESPDTEVDDNNRVNQGNIATSIVADTKLYAVQMKDDIDTRVDKNAEQNYKNREKQVGRYSRDSPLTPRTPAFKSAFLETPPEKESATGSFISQPISLFSEFEFSSSPRERESSMMYSGENVEGVIEGMIHPPEGRVHRLECLDEEDEEDDGGERDGDDEGEGEEDIDSREYNRYTDLSNPEYSLRASGVGVSVSRLPGLAEYIDQQMDCIGSQSSTGSCDYYSGVQPAYSMQYTSEGDLGPVNSIQCDRFDDDYSVDSSPRFVDTSLISPGNDRGESETDNDPHLSQSGPSIAVNEEYSLKSLPDTIDPPTHPPTHPPSHDLGPETVTPETGGAPPAPFLAPFGDCRVDLYNQGGYNDAFNDTFFSAYSDATDVVNQSTKVKAVDVSMREEAKRFPFPIGSKRPRERDLTSLLNMTREFDEEFDALNSSVRESYDLIRAPSTVTTAMTLRREMLSDLKTIGQVDSKYLLVMSGKHILIVDQHAADERVKLEQMLHSVDRTEESDENDERESESSSGGKGVGVKGMKGMKGMKGVSAGMITGSQAVSEVVDLAESDLYTLLNRREVFTEWMFLFDRIVTPDSDTMLSDGDRDGDAVGLTRSGAADGHTQIERQTDRHTRDGDTGGSTGGHTGGHTNGHARSVRLIQVPIIYGEALNAQDFLEFMESLSGPSSWSAPRSMIRPPSVRRIAASKACRTAVKFGDILSQMECADIMKKLSETKLPFQCAHGRPSVVPLLLLENNRDITTARIELKVSKQERTPTYSNIFRRISK